MEHLHQELRLLRGDVDALREQNARLRCAFEQYMLDGAESQTVTAQEPAFYRLSTELLVMIADCATSTEADSEEGKERKTEAMLRLRLIHPRFAYLDNIMRHLFHDIDLMPLCPLAMRDESHLQALASISAWVRTVNFKAKALPLRVVTPHPMHSPSASHEVTRTTNEDQLLQSCREQDAPTQVFFTKALGLLTRITCARVRLPDRHSLANTLFYPDDHRLITLAGEVLVLRTVAHRILELDIHLENTYCQDSYSPSRPQHRRRWQSFWRLPRLQKLQISEYYYTDITREPREWKSTDSCFIDLLGIHAATLKELTIERSALNWCEHNHVVMSHLQKLKLNDVKLYIPDDFEDLLGKCCNLRELTITESDRYHETNGRINERDLFRIIRDHPAKMTVIFDPILTCHTVLDSGDADNLPLYLQERPLQDDFWFYLRYHTAEPVHMATFSHTLMEADNDHSRWRDSDAPGHDDRERTCKAIVAYIAGSGSQSSSP